MSTINVTNLKGRGGASPTLPDGAVITGVVTATSFSGSGANLTGIANTDFVVGTAITMAVGNIANVNFTKSAAGAGATVGSFTGVTTFYGDGSNLAGVGESIAPWTYNPDIGDTTVDVDTGIGITFNKKVLAGSGTATLKIVNAGTAGTTIQSWGITSFTQGAVTDITLGTLVSSLTVKQTYQLDIPEGFIVDASGTAYAGTAYTFTTTDPVRKLWAWGGDNYGSLGQNQSDAHRSSPVQIPGVTWKDFDQETGARQYHMVTKKTDGTLWAWGLNNYGQLADNSTTQRSSPVQIPGTTWGAVAPITTTYTVATKTNGTLWVWGSNTVGQLGLNQGPTSEYSSPIQIPGTTWRSTAGSVAGGYRWASVLKTDGTLWMLGGEDDRGELCQNNNANFSSPTQIHGSGTTWNYVGGGEKHGCAIKTDGTLWTWGENVVGQLGINDTNRRSSPVQVPGTTWSKCCGGENGTVATKTDGTAWVWGQNQYGQCAQNNTVQYSSPVQIPGTTWSRLLTVNNGTGGIKTDGTIWMWGQAQNGKLGQNGPANTHRSSPVQVTSETGYTSIAVAYDTMFANQLDQTP